MNRNPDEVTAVDVTFLGISIAGVLTGVGAVMTLTLWAGVLGFVMLLLGLAYFGIRQLIGA
jgi:hypothetical protein